MRRALAAALVLTACMPADPQEARRQAYLDCARAQGVTVRDGTIVADADGLRRLDACRAIPR
ncbi:hypothetical protein JQC91_05555 [Jannaschia sp. Os4]|uniref:hypothetical protein n=1 Tax=Jannaschia sp. Os4 TaxID=2807617 RepID=UPI00193A5C54|nr:hypothetical protein [Jannaschia sp. Os4]MBM2575766.1 hypothetical protein [Jannaschia sp. Os4]